MKRAVSFSVVLLLAALFAWSALSLGSYVATNDAAQTLVEEFGILGMLVMGVISGINLVVPIHAASFTPIFLSAGFSLLVIILTLAAGRLIADIFAFFLGRWGKESTHERFPGFYGMLERFESKHRRLITPGVFLYAAFAPIPNEAILIPLGLMGYGFRTLIVPLILGTLLNQMLYTVGFVGIFNAFF